MKELVNIQDTSQRITLVIEERFDRFKHNIERLAANESVSFGSVFEKLNQLNRFAFLLDQQKTTSSFINIAQTFREASELVLQIKNEGELISKSFRDSRLPEEGLRVSNLLRCYSVLFQAYSLIGGFEDENDIDKNTKDKDTIEIDLVNWTEGVELIAQLLDDNQCILPLYVQDFIEELANFILDYISNLEFKYVKATETEAEDEISFNKNKKRIQYISRSILWVLEHDKDDSPNASWEEEERIEMLPEFTTEAFNHTSFSYKKIYQEAKNAVETNEKEKLIATLRSWRKEYIDELDKLSEN